MTGRVPPNALDAEGVVLSAVLLDADALDHVADVLRVEHFYADSNRRIFEAALTLRETGKPIDIVSLATVLRDSGRLAQVGGTPYLASLVEGIPHAAHVDHHAKTIREKWRQRRAVEICQEALVRGYEPLENVQEYLTGLEGDLAKLSESELTKALEPVGEVLGRALRAQTDTSAEAQSSAPIPTGFPLVDSIMSGFVRTDLYVVGARPGMGKTALVTGFACNVARGKNTPGPGAGVALFSLEMGREQVALRFGCHEAEVDLWQVRARKLTSKDWQKLLYAAEKLRAMPLYVDDTPALTLVDLRSRIRKLKRELHARGIPLGLVIVDYLQLMTGVTGRGVSREQEVSSISRGLKGLAKDEDVPIIAVSQLNRHLERNTKDKRPTLADLRESGAIEQDADTIMFLYREAYYDREARGSSAAEVIFAKQRNGPTGMVELFFRDSCARFYPLTGERPASDWSHEEDDWTGGNR